MHKFEQEPRSFFRLFPDVLYAGGAQGGVLYLMVEARMLKLGSISSQILKHSERGYSIAETCEYLAIPHEMVAKVLNRLEEIGAGCYMQTACFVEKLRQPDLTKGFTLVAEPPRVECFRVSLSGRCRQNCEFCDPDDAENRLKPCLGCRKARGIGSDTLSIEQIKRAVEQVAMLDCRRLILSVGDPEQEEDLSLRSIDAAAAAGFSSVEYIAGSPLSESFARQLLDRSVIPRFQVFSSRDQIHDTIFGSRHGLSRLRENFEMIRASGKPYNVCYLYASTKDDPAATIDWLKESGATLMYLDRVRDIAPKGGNFLIGENNLTPPGVDRYIRMLEVGHCLSSMLTLNHDGSYHFCPALFDTAIGHVDSDSVQQIFARLDTDGKRTDIDVPEALHCSACMYRLACQVCKAASAQSLGPICGYHASA